MRLRRDDAVRKRLHLCAAVLCCALLSACSGISLGGTNVEELLRAPRPSEQQSAVQTALNNYLGETLQLKYPRTGDVQDPVIFADLDGDGAEEAAVLYTAESKGQNVHLAVLEQDGGVWSIAYEVMGLSTEVVQVELVQVFDDSTQLVVGYGNANLAEKYLEVYDYRDVTIYSSCRQPYDAYRIGDLTGEGTQLAIVSAASTPSGLALQLFAPSARALTLAQTVPLDERMERCTAVYPTQYGTARGLIVDGTESSGTASQLLYWTGSAFALWPNETEAGGYFIRSWRADTLSALRPTDLVGTGEVLIPQTGAAIPTLRSARRFYPVEWMNYLCADEPMRQYGIFDAQYGYFVRLPAEWKDAVTLSEPSDSDWQIRSREDNSLLCAVRVADLNASGGTYTEAARLAEKKVLLYFGEACTAAQASLIQRGVTVLE